MNRLLIRRRLSELLRNVQKLQALRSLPYEEWIESTERIWAVEHGLQISIQIVLDVGNHLLAGLGENDVDDYASVIDRMGSAGILPQEFSKRIRPMAGLRNILVHEYAEVDLKEVHRILQDHLRDFETFVEEVEAYLERSG
jgi:uncharacterized protein YutE (UPF0331/DUF86 family)